MERKYRPVKFQLYKYAHTLHGNIVLVHIDHVFDHCINIKVDLTATHVFLTINIPEIYFHYFCLYIYILSSFRRKISNYSSTLHWGSVLFILSDTIHIMIHIKRYSICINDTFCLVLDKKTWLIHKFHGNLGILMTKIS